MKVAAFLPTQTLDTVKEAIPPHRLLSARSWEDLHSSLERNDIIFALIDPATEGRVNLLAAKSIIRRHRPIPVVAYVGMTPENLQAVSYLSKIGLYGVLVLGDSESHQELLNLAKRFFAHPLAQTLLAVFERRLSQLPPPLLAVTVDMFERPERYRSTLDIAAMSKLSLRTIYRAFMSGGFGTPRKLLVAARIARAYALLKQTQEPIHVISDSVGFSNRRTFSQRFGDVIGTSPSVARSVGAVPDILEHILEWLYKPPRRNPAHLRSN